MQQRIYTQEEHKLELSAIDRDALYVLEKLTAAGHTAYLVGGGVRDLLLQQKPKDYDISTSAKPEEVKKLFRNCILIGRRFRLAHVRFGKKVIEVSTFRTGDNTADELILRDNDWGTEEEDVLRRDFTINGLFYDAAERTVIDYVNGLQDIKKGHLKTIGLPFLRFKQDPVRMFRLLKFKARFGFTVDEEAETALVESRHEILKSSPARILEELLRMLESGSSEQFFKLLSSYGFLQLILPTFASFLEMDEGEEIYALLKELDNHYQRGGDVLDRSIALGCLLFPALSRRLHLLFTEDKPPHLGQIQNEAFSLFHETLDSFLQIPKKLKIMTVFLLSAQYRLVPLQGKKPKSYRIPNDPSFSFAIDFLKLRAESDDRLQKAVKPWETALASYLKQEPSTSLETDPKPQNKRRRRRRPPRTS